MVKHLQLNRVTRRGRLVSVMICCAFGGMFGTLFVLASVVHQLPLVTCCSFGMVVCWALIAEPLRELIDNTIEIEGDENGTSDS